MSAFKVAKTTWSFYRDHKDKQRQQEVLKRLGLDITDRFYYPENTIEGKHSYTVIAAVYGVEKYLNDMMASLIRQTLDFKKHIQVILVDDGSIDRSGDICKEWAAKFPDNVMVIHKENGGQASARNAGIPHATGDWITFIDPDDLVDKNYFLEVDKSIKRNENLDIVSCNFIAYFEDGNIIRDNHPLKYRFQHGERVSVFDEHCDDVHLNVSTAFFKKETLRESGLLFEEIKANGEDFLFVSQFLIYCRDARVLFLPSAFYWYRKRSDKSSSIDTGWGKEGRYTEIYDLCVATLLDAKKNYGYIPKWLQRSTLYRTVWDVKYFFNSQSREHLIPRDLKDGFRQRIKLIFKYIDDDIVQNFELAGVNDRHKNCILSLKGIKSLNSELRFEKWDKDGFLCLSLDYLNDKPGVEVYLGGLKANIEYEKVRENFFLSDYSFSTLYIWLSWRSNEMLKVYINGEYVELSVNNRSKSTISRSFIPKVRNSSSFPPAVRFYRALSQISYFKTKYENAWIFMDRSDRADDNAEHLYRWVKENRPKINSWFVINRDSSDWDRLKKEGFNLVAFNSLQHKMLYLNAVNFLSSHCDDYMFNIINRKYYPDLIRWSFAYLKHGVIAADFSERLNNKTIDILITASEDEYYSIAGPVNKYKYSGKEVKLTGLPRHDRLHKINKNKRFKNILVMPTWRKSIVGHGSNIGGKRTINDDFLFSPFYKNWSLFLNSKNLASLCETYGYKLLLYPHPNLEPYLNYFKNENIEVLNPTNYSSIQDVFIKSDILITDYSSVAFEFAYLKKPIIYYQFDASQFFSSHTSQLSYFEYVNDGFGPVCKEKSNLLDELETYLKTNCLLPEIYEKRQEKFFNFRDGGACQRVYNIISGENK